MILSQRGHYTLLFLIILLSGTCTRNREKKAIDSVINLATRSYVSSFTNKPVILYGI